MAHEPGTQVELDEIRSLARQQETWRAETLNLIASENVLSPSVRRALDNDWLGRYADYTGRDLTNRRYRGTRYIVKLEQIVERLARQLFRAEFVECRPLAGHLAGAAVISGLCSPGDIVLEVGPEGGSHREASKLAMPSLLALKVHFLPFDGLRFNITIPEAVHMINELQPRMVILGSSTFLFPHPVQELKSALQRARPDGILVYDASHVMGLIAAGRFQDPLGEGADIVFGSTHKTFPGPQGGIIFTNREDLIAPVSEAVYPAFVTNHHAFRMPALAITFLEMRTFGTAYANQIVSNSQVLGDELQKQGFECVQVDGCFSQSHTLLLKVGKIGDREQLAKRLESADIITTACALPKEQGAQGIRLGVQELTRRGASERDMREAARLIAATLLEKQPVSEIAGDVHSLAAKLSSIHYTWQESSGV